MAERAGRKPAETLNCRLQVHLSKLRGGYTAPGAAQRIRVGSGGSAGVVVARIERGGRDGDLVSCEGSAKAACGSAVSAHGDIAVDLCPIRGGSWRFATVEFGLAMMLTHLRQKLCAGIGERKSGRRWRLDQKSPDTRA